MPVKLFLLLALLKYFLVHFRLLPAIELFCVYDAVEKETEEPRITAVFVYVELAGLELQTI